MNTKRRCIVVFVNMGLLVSLAACGSLPNPFASPTPTFTLTPTSTPTLTPSPTATATVTPSPTATPLPTGAETENQSDGSVLFKDYDNDFQLALPENWFVVPVSSKDMVRMLETMVDDNPQLKDTLEAFKTLDPDVIRLVAIHRDPRYFVNGFTTNITITAIDNELMGSLPLDLVSGALEETMKQSGNQPDVSFTPADENPNGVELAALEFQQSTVTASKATVDFYSKLFIFQSNKKLITVQLSVPKQFSEDLKPDLQSIIDSLEHIQP